ncbi:glycosyltransferase family 4 protein [Salegentibacter salegens]|uniref:Glycosyltransferase involved in cell wall bisynthesis n=1 Tax=Salegentibacter salegens TaxID=143223 RepID=A0A1M7IWQ4_9FLAO|nr:glycosyltransferase family 4 protein [Salegentibacter salegens]PRX49836.1 glycosyltransferase involved in cell wall biosynthesis [Salegentibacter salegens]SHM45171.1 Glycosyltransferase involved in cell wall bisynthesis [Salegentibacter salegens]
MSLPKSRLLVIGCVWPEPNSSAAGSRMLQLLQFFLAENYKITFVTTSARSEFAVDLEKMNITSEVIKMNHPSFDEMLKRISPDLVLFDRFMTEEQFGWRVDEICPEAVKILDTEDLHFLRKTRIEAFKKNIPAEEIYFDADITKREIASIYRCDLSLIISEVEMKLLQKEFNIPQNLLHYLPFLLEPISEEEKLSLPAFKNRKDFISIGNFLHEPNWNAVLYLKEKIWPLIRQELPDAKLNIYGSYPSQKIWNLHNEKEGFIVQGRAENAEIVMKNAKVCLAPIQFGAGLKGKLIQAMQCGTPSITTAIGAEGIAGALDWNGFITNQPKDFAQKAVQLYSEENLWENSAENGFRIINSRFNKEAFQHKLSERLLNLIQNIATYRQKNFIGKMLQHHQHRSTYFMAKFIEEKEKR